MVTKMLVKKLFKCGFLLQFNTRTLGFSAVVLALITFSDPVRADTDIQSLRNQIETLGQQLANTRAEMQDVQRIVYSESLGKEGLSNIIPAPDSDPTSKATNRLAILETHVDEYDLRLRQANGKFDELSNKIERISSRIEKLIDDVDFRLATLETAISENTNSNSEGLSGNLSESVPNILTDQENETKIESNSGTIETNVGEGYEPSEEPKVLGTLRVNDAGKEDQQRQETFVSIEPSSTSQESPEEQYAHAMSLMQDDDWENAGLALKKFVTDNQNHHLAQNAAYWQGESFYARKQFEDAARLYALNFKRYPKGKKAPDNLLKLGFSLLALKRMPEACQTFDKLQQDFPQVRNSITNAVNLGRTKARCN